MNKYLVLISILSVLGNCATISIDTKTALDSAPLSIVSDPGYITKASIDESFPVPVIVQGFKKITSCHALDPNGNTVNGDLFDTNFNKCQFNMFPKDSLNRSNAGDFVVTIAGEEGKVVNATIPLTLVSDDFRIDAAGVKDSGEQAYFECKLTGFSGTPKVLLVDGTTIISSDPTVIQSGKEIAVFSFPIQRGLVLKELHCKINATNAHPYELPQIPLTSKSLHVELDDRGYLHYSNRVFKGLFIGFFLGFCVMFVLYIKGKDIFKMGLIGLCRLRGLRCRIERPTSNPSINGNAGLKGISSNNASHQRPIIEIMPGQTNTNSPPRSNDLPSSEEPSSTPARNGSCKHLMDAECNGITTENACGLINAETGARTRNTHQTNVSLLPPILNTSNYVVSNNGYSNDSTRRVLNSSTTTDQFEEAIQDVDIAQSFSVVDCLTNGDNGFDNNRLSPLQANLSSTNDDTSTHPSVHSSLELNEENRLSVRSDATSKDSNETIELCPINTSKKVLSEVALSNRPTQTDRAPNLN